MATHPVDEVLPAGKLGVLGLQHVLVMYALNLYFNGAKGDASEAIAATKHAEA